MTFESTSRVNQQKNNLEKHSSCLSRENNFIRFVSIHTGTNRFNTPTVLPFELAIPSVGLFQRARLCFRVIYRSENVANIK